METIITVNNVWSKINDLPNIDVVDDLDARTSFFVQGYQYMRAYTHGRMDSKTGKLKYWDGKRHLLTKDLVFPTGLLKRVSDCLTELGVEFKIKDIRPRVDSSNPLKVLKYQPRPYQQEAADAFYKTGRGILRLATGAGKTFLAAVIAAEYNVPTVIYVVGKDLLYQFYSTFKEVLPVDIGIVGDGQCDIKRITICSIWTAAAACGIKQNKKDYEEDWDPTISKLTETNKSEIQNMIMSSNLGIVDECHYAATQTIQNIFKASKRCRYFCGMSASSWRDDGSDLLLESVCGPQLFNLPAKQLIDQKYLVMPKIVFYNVPYDNELSRGKSYMSIYNSYIVNNPTRNELIVNVAKKLIEKGRKVLILVRNISHGKKLLESLGDISIFFLNGSQDGETRNNVKEMFINGEYKCIIASSIFDQGVDIPNLDALILAGSGKSSIRALQRIGRVIRTSENKEDALVVDFLDNAKYLDSHSRIRAAIYKQEQFKVKFPKGLDERSIGSNFKILQKMK